MIIKFCEQCYKGMWAKRSTKRFCSPTCRQRHYRGNSPVGYWCDNGDSVEVTQERCEQFLASVIDGDEPMHKRLVRYRDTYGAKALLELIEISIRMQSG